MIWITILYSRACLRKQLPLIKRLLAQRGSIRWQNTPCPKEEDREDPATLPLHAEETNAAQDLYTYFLYPIPF